MTYQNPQELRMLLQTFILVAALLFSAIYPILGSIGADELQNLITSRGDAESKALIEAFSEEASLGIALTVVGLLGFVESIERSRWAKAPVPGIVGLFCAVCLVGGFVFSFNANQTLAEIKFPVGTQLEFGLYGRRAGIVIGIGAGILGINNVYWSIVSIGIRKQKDQEASALVGGSSL